jgi:hypothetical protein
MWGSLAAPPMLTLSCDFAYARNFLRGFLLAFALAATRLTLREIDRYPRVNRGWLAGSVRSLLGFVASHIHQFRQPPVHTITFPVP